MGTNGASFWPNLWRCYGLAWGHPWVAVAALLLTAAMAGLTGALVWVLDRVFTLFADAEARLSDGDSEAVAVAAGEMMELGWLLLPIAPVVALAAYASWYLGQWVANRGMQDLRTRFLDHLIGLDLGFHGQLAKGDLLSRLSADMVTMQSLIQLLFAKLLQRSLEIIALIGFLYVVNWRLALLLTAVCLPVGLVLGRQFKRTRKRAQHAREHLADTVVVLEQVTSGIRVIKAMGSNMREKARYEEINQDLFKANMKVAKSRGGSDAASNGLAFLLFGAALLVGALLFRSGTITPSHLVVFLGAIGRLATLARTTQRAWGEVVEQIPAAERIFAILDRPSAIVDGEHPTPCPMPRRELALNDVTFRYDSEAEAVLAGCSLQVPVGSTVALVGESGGGKSTVLDLLARFHDVESGTVTIDGTDVRDFSAQSLISHFAIVGQDSFLFNDTVAANIRYGRPGASEAEIQEAARRAHVHDTILGLEGGKGYDTVVGDRGERLSGGQRQRVAIARALLRDAPVLLLDEPTSALDAVAEQHVQEALQELMKGRTCVVVAHRLATVQHADRIYVLGREARGVIESGSHRDLLEAGGAYARLVELQQLDA
jgi:subfamily B ATP-binding cassette protein MsbA